jgi:hypothetical protein
MEWFGLLVVIAIILMVTSLRVVNPKEPDNFSKERLAALIEEERKQGPGGLAKGNPGLVQCGVAKPTVPIYMRTPELRARAQELAVSVSTGKKAIADHMAAMRQGVTTDNVEIRTIIAGVVRDRKTLKKLQYDQPF